MPHTPQHVTALLDEMRKTYISHLPDKIDDLEASVLRLENADNYTDAFESVYRATHSLKGSAGTYGIQILSTVCHHLEDRLTSMGESFRNNAGATTRKLLDHIDLMREIVNQLINDQNDFTSIEEKLGQLRRQCAVKKYHSLIADTSNVDIEITKGVFEHYPVEFTIVSNGQLALQRALHEHFDLIITSAELPVLNGHALIAALRLSNSPCRHTSTLLLTSKHIDGYHRNTDPDFIIYKDQNLLRNYAAAATATMNLLTKT